MYVKRKIQPVRHEQKRFDWHEKWRLTFCGIAINTMYRKKYSSQFPNVIMTNRAKEYQYVCLYPGEIYIAETPAIIWTVLGSCLAIVFHHHASECGAICHAQLSERGLGISQCSRACPNPCFASVSGENPFKFVSCSIRHFVEYFAEKGIYPPDLEVKLFGGANVLVSSPIKTVGEMNIEVAERLLDDYQLRVVSKQVGGNNGRTLYFYSDTGEVFLKRHSTTIAR